MVIGSIVVPSAFIRYLGHHKICDSRTNITTFPYLSLPKLLQCLRPIDERVQSSVTFGHASLPSIAPSPVLFKADRPSQPRRGADNCFEAASAFRAGPHSRNKSFQEHRMILGIGGWLIVGLVIGFIASKLVNLRGDDPRFGIFVAIGGGLVLAIGYTIVSGAGISAFNPRSLIFAAVGASIGAVLWHIIRSRYTTREIYTSRRSY
jgi:uncharacterized membrane protein YeaQ/YmgE (transglycosylase-associated protein family)